VRWWYTDGQEASWKNSQVLVLVKYVKRKVIINTESAQNVELLAASVEEGSMLRKVLQFILSVLTKLGIRKEAPVILVQPSSSSSPIPPPVSEPSPAAAPPSPPAGELRSWDEAKLLALYPPFAEVVRQFVLEANKQGMVVGIYSGFRTMAQQRDLYARGRDTDGKILDRSQIVTNAPPGFSFHNYGLAVDLVFDEHPTEPGWKWSWDSNFPWDKLAKLGQSKFGLEAAYFWRLFPEGPHYQMSHGIRAQEFLTVYNDGGIPSVWAKLDEIRKSQS